MTLNKNLRYFIPAAVVLGLLALAATVYANPFYNGTKARTATATTTISYLIPGISTTTLTYDSYEQSGTNQTNGGNVTLPDSVAIALRGNSSSTASVINITCEYSEDAIDWYQNELVAPTSTSIVNITNPIFYSFAFASSTVGGVPGTSSTVFQKVFECPVPLRYVRAVIGSAGAQSSVWASIIPKKQRN